MASFVDPSFSLTETVRRYQARFQEGVTLRARELLTASHPDVVAFSAEVILEAEKEACRSLTEALARWKGGELATRECLETAEQCCDRSSWVHVVVAASQESLGGVKGASLELGYDAEGSGVFTDGELSSLGLLVLRIPPVMDLLSPLATLQGVEAVYDGDRSVTLPAPATDVVAAQLHESVTVIDPESARLDLGLENCGKGVRVCVVDTGIDSTHPDLAGAVEAWADFTGEDDGVDYPGHGTHVAGIVAGRGVASGGRYTGVAPGAALLSAKVLNRYGAGSVVSVLFGLEWAARQGAHVVNLSLGHDSTQTNGLSAESRACAALVARGVVVVVSAGNSGPGPGTVGIPGDTRDAVTVGALSRAGGVCGFSSRGPTANPALTGSKPDLLAPGDKVVSCLSSHCAWPPVPDHAHYTAVSGTSMAAPMVSGCAAVLLSGARNGGGLSPLELKQALTAACIPLENAPPEAQGAGVVNLSRALRALNGENGGQNSEVTMDGPMNQEPGVLSLEEVADYLKISSVTLYRLVRQGKIPGFKIGGAWRFRKATIDDWIARQEMAAEDASPAPGAAFSSVCGVCGMRLPSAPDNTCAFDECDRPICDRCWTRHGRHLCTAHKDIPPSPVKSPASEKARDIGDICSICDAVIDSPHKTCEASGCWNPICMDCWDGTNYGRSRHYCEEHEDLESGAPQTAAGGVAARSGDCSICGATLDSSARRCSESGCWNMICSDCWSGTGAGWGGVAKHYCIEHRNRHWSVPAPSAASRPAGTPAPGSPLGSSLLALETAFMERLRVQFLETRELFHPQTNASLALDGAWSVVQEGDERGEMLRDPGVPFSRDELAKRFPGNRFIVYSVNLPKGVLGQKAATVLLEARFWSPWRGLLTPSPSCPRRSRAELAEYVQETLKRARKGGKRLVLALFSPEGWEEDALRYVVPGDSGAMRFSSPDLSLVLLGKGPGDLWFDPGDTAAALFAPLLSAELSRDVESRCRRAIEERLALSDYVTLPSLVEELALPAAVVRRAMESLGGRSGIGKAEDLPGVGFVLRKTNP